jgi:hypothetical protein
LLIQYDHPVTKPCASPNARFDHAYMPPSCGNDDESAVMQRAFGTKKKMPAATHRPMDDGPDAAANAIHRGERIAATFMRTRS